MLATIGAAIGTFAGTNVDDIVVLAVLFATGRTRPWRIWLGQYVGVGVLVAVSVLAALGLTLVPDRWVGLLGLIPLALGLYGLLGLIRTVGADDEREPRTVVTGWPSVAAVTIANGGDNIAVYTPMFRAIGAVDTIVTISVFLVLIALWCQVGGWLGGHRHITSAIERFGHWLVPVVYIVVGLVIVLTGEPVDLL